MNPAVPHQSFSLAKKILLAMLLGVIVGMMLNLSPTHELVQIYVINGILEVIGKIFIAILTMLVVPIVFVSLVCGTCHLGDIRKFGGLALKTLGLYIITTAIAITLGLIFATLFDIGGGSHLAAPIHFSTANIPSLKETLINMIPTNPFRAFVEGNMLQVIIFAILFGAAIALSGSAGKRIADIFMDLNKVVMKLITMMMNMAPYGVFCLIAGLFAKMGFGLILQLLGYFLTVLFVLFLHVILTNSILLRFFAGLNPLTFFKKMYSAMIFAFSTSSSNASIPVTLDAVENKLGVKNSVAAFVVPLGATINMDGTAIMQGVATVFIAQAYNIDIGIVGYLTVILTATLASIGTAGVPGVGLITLTMVLKQVGLPVEGIAMIIGVDRLLDMVRTAVNITGDAAVSTVVAKSENEIDVKTFKS